MSVQLAPIQVLTSAIGSLDVGSITPLGKMEGSAQEHLAAASDECHGRCYGFQKERDNWAPPRVAVQCDADARPGYDSMSASEYVDAPEVLQRKIFHLARLVMQSQRCVVYSGAGLSTDAGISDYASQAPGSISGVTPPSHAGLLSEIANAGGDIPKSKAPSLRSPLCAQPTLAHRVLVAMHKAGHVHRWINQNHDGLPQKAGFPQEAINEIHGAWHAPDNMVVPMSGALREDLFSDLLTCEANADLVIAVGTSLCGMNADRVVTTTAVRASQGQAGQLGSVVIGLQRTMHDKDSTLRIFARCNDVFSMLAEELSLCVPECLADGTFFIPEVLVGRSEEEYIFQDLQYDAAGQRSTTSTITLDLRDDAKLVIPTGMHAGATGVVDGPFDREGNIRCRFTLKPKQGKLRAPMPLLLGRWWIQAAVEGTVFTLPVVNEPADSDESPVAQKIRELVKAYAN